MSTPDRLLEIRARHVAATPGPWEPSGTYGTADHYAYRAGEYERGVGTIHTGQGEQADADKALILHAHEDIGTLLDRLQQAEDVCRAVQAWIDTPPGGYFGATPDQGSEIGAALTAWRTGHADPIDQDGQVGT